MSDDLVKRLRNTPNWMREEYAHYKDGLKVFDRAPFEAAYALEAQAARIAALEAAVTQCRTLSAMLKPQADRIAELEAALKDMAKHVWRGDWDKLKPETRALLDEKK